MRSRVAALRERDYSRSAPLEARLAAQHERLGLPELPTTTIGSFPQTAEIRDARRRHRAGELDDTAYDRFLHSQVEEVVREQEQLGLDVLVHGEPERNDMVEYFGERLDGFVFSQWGWVQSYGSRCVKPPILFGDVARPAAMTVRWWQAAQALTERPMKGMLTGPVTILQWSFVRDDQPRSETCTQIALAIQDEVLDLEAAGAAVIQVDEAALREGLPLRTGRPGRLRALGDRLLPPDRRAGRTGDPDPHAHVLLGVRRDDRAHRAPRRRRDLDRGLALGHGAARRLP